MIGKWILIFGVLLVLVGVMAWVAAALGLPPGRLPGDIRWRNDGWSLAFAIVTCVVVSILLTVLVNLVLWYCR